MLTMEPGTDEQTEIEAWLTEEGRKTRLVVEERGLPLAPLHHYGAGWQAHLEDLGRSLRGYGSIWHDRWTELAPGYEQLGVQ
ncbi:SRPBCC family protein [Microlunatus endophyticus]